MNISHHPHPIDPHIIAHKIKKKLHIYDTASPLPRCALHFSLSRWNRYEHIVFANKITKYQRGRFSTSLLGPCFCLEYRTGIDGRVVKALDLRPNGRYSPRGFKPRSIHAFFAVSVCYHILSTALHSCFVCNERGAEYRSTVTPPHIGCLFMLFGGNCLWGDQPDKTPLLPWVGASSS